MKGERAARRWGGRNCNMRNIKLIYILSILYNSWFWIGIWVLYYLRYTSYAGIGLLESVMIFTSTTTEIPTGAIADLLGRKKTLTMSLWVLLPHCLF